MKVIRLILKYFPIFTFFSAAAQCNDSSQLIKYAIPYLSNSQAPFFSIPKKDGGLFIARKGNGSYLLNLSSKNKIVWSKSLPSLSLQPYFKIIELSDGGVVTAAGQSYPNPELNQRVLKQDVNGNAKWGKQYKTPLSNSVLRSCGEGKYNDLLLASYAPEAVLIQRIDSLGNIDWSKNFTSLFEGSINLDPLIGITVIEEDVFVLGQFSCYSCNNKIGGIWILRVDYKTGLLRKVKAYELPLINDIECNSCFTPRNFTRTKHAMIITGSMTIGSPIADNLAEVIIKVDTSLNIQSAAMLSTPYKTGEVKDFSSSSAENSNTVFAFRKDQNNYYYAIVDSANTIIRQRKLVISAPLNGAFDDVPIIYGNDGQVIFFHSANGVNARDLYVSFTQPQYLNNQECSGIDTLMFQLNDIGLTNFPLFFNQGYDQTFTVSNLLFNPKDELITEETICKKISTCNLLKLKADSFICFSNPYLSIKASKNTECLRSTDWKIDTAFHEIISITNDTILNIRFKKPWQGYIYANIAGCTLKDSVFVTCYAPVDSIFLGKDTMLCPKQTFLLKAPAGYQSYKWQDGSATPSILVKNAGLYRVLVTDKCNNKIQGSIHISYEAMQLTIMPAVTELCKSDQTTIKATEGFSKYLWQPISGIVGSATGNVITVAPASNTKYKVIASSDKDCIYSDTATIAVKNCLNQLYVPTGFTPNNDNLNDLLKPLFSNTPEWFEFKIFNRYGQIVFITSKAGEGWNGMVAGQKQQSSTFVWFCRYKFKNQPEQLHKGSFVLLR